MPSKTAATIMAKNENGATIIGMIINKAVMEVSKATTVKYVMALLNSSSKDPLIQIIRAENEAITELELEIANKERRPLKYQPLIWNLDGKERTRTKAVIETAPKNPALDSNPWWTSLSRFIVSHSFLRVVKPISSENARLRSCFFFHYYDISRTAL